MSTRRRNSRYRACAALSRSPCASSVARAASSNLTGQLRSREASAISASATRHLARATASLGLKARAALRKRALARTRSPSCAIAIPRSASAGASSRRATRFNAPRGSPEASARAAAVISESMSIRQSIRPADVSRIPPHLSLPAFQHSRLSLSREQQTPGYVENGQRRQRGLYRQTDAEDPLLAERKALPARGVAPQRWKLSWKFKGGTYVSSMHRKRSCNG